MTIWLIISGIIAPALFWIGYLYYKDRYQPEPLIAIGSTYIFGFIMAFVCSNLYTLLPLIKIPTDPSYLMENNRILFFIYAVGVVGVLEELCKFIPFLLIIYTFKKFDEKIDGIIYASLIALGFASYENLLYLPYLDGFELFGRAVASPLTHTIFSSLWGYRVGVAKLEKKSIFKASINGLLLAIFLHGLFDFLTTAATLRIFSALLILIIWVWRIIIIEKPEQGN
jgi:RsiW-degrading membrane proteinase PrsW (M82 family)